jgi:spermidine/putrescine transport system ATP-binding protein
VTARPRSLPRAVRAPSIAAMGERPFLILEHVSKSYEALTAVDDVSLEIRRGEFITLLGPSGCGKTTLLRLLAGFERPTAGRIRLDGADLVPVPPERRPFNMVFQSYALFPHMNVYDNVAYGLRTAGLREPEVRRKAMAVLEMVGLAEHARRAVPDLSGGMSQRVALARAIVNEPRALLLDEPLGALDLQLRKQLQLELRAIQDRVSTTFVYVTHDQEEALVMSHRVVLMRQGRVVQAGTPREVYSQPQTRFVAEFVGETTMIPCTVISRHGDRVQVAMPDGSAGEFSYFGTADSDSGEAGLVSLRPEDVRVAASGEATFTGLVETPLFVGGATHHMVRLADGSVIRVRANDGDAAEPGQRVSVAVLPGRGVFVPAEERSVEPSQ